MLPRRFALIRHVDYSGAAGTGVIAYGVAFDDGQVVLRWSSTHRATSVLDSVEDLIAAHGHGETTSIEWIDAPPGKADGPAHQGGGRRARRTSSPNDALSTADVPQMQKPPATVPSEPVDDCPAGQSAQEPAEQADVRPTQTHPAPAAAEPADVRPAAQTPRTQPAPADSRRTTAPPTVPAAATPTQSASQPAASAQPAQSPAATAPASAQPASQAPVPAQPAASTSPWHTDKRPGETSAQPNASDSPSGPPPIPQTTAGQSPTPAAPAAYAPPSPTSNGARHLSNASQPAEATRSGSASSPTDPARAEDTSRTERTSDRPSHDHDADIVDHSSAGRNADDERRSRHAMIATQPMNADLPEESSQRRPRRATPPHESPRSIFDEVEEPARPDLRLASSNGRSRDIDDADDSGDGSPGRDEFGGFFAAGHQHLDTVTGLLDLPASLDRRGRGASNDKDTTSRRNGRHRGE